MCDEKVQLDSYRVDVIMKSLEEKILNTAAISPSTLISDIPLPKSYVDQQEKEMSSNRSIPPYTRLAELGLGGLVVKYWLSIQKK